MMQAFSDNPFPFLPLGKGGQETGAGGGGGGDRA